MRSSKGRATLTTCQQKRGGMGNHEFCTECGESDFHYGTPCDEDKKKAHKSNSTQVVLPNQPDTRRLFAQIHALEAELDFAKSTIRMANRKANYSGCCCAFEGSLLCSDQVPLERWCLPCSVRRLLL